MRIKITVSYDGTNYCGWQVQPSGVSVQSVLADAIEKLTGERTTVTGSGRTDAGVHAKGQVAHFDVENSTIPPENFYKALNTVLPFDIKVLDSERAQDSFHACRGAKKKTYCYTLYNGQVDMPLYDRYAVKIEKPLDLTAIEKVKKEFIGEHDFKCFNASGGGAKTTVRTIYDIKVVTSGDFVKFYVTGNGFLYKMVRSLVGFLVAVGENKANEKDALEMLSKGTRTNKVKTLSARGLCLESVVYE
ncbi:MAG: tRNA pseudouridine(38-40) synthase TruA [Clostridia bacterium]|nr:tRNA pseudouridine(38-40) synthase TruA [Clostridia bacterium]